ncbi:MAG: 4Fe-4S binding protein [Gemmataceae bacterium]
MAKVYPEAQLPLRDGDIDLTDEEFQTISFLACLARDRKEKLLKYPGAMRLRQVRKGDVICRQNEEGATAFFILRPADWLRLQTMLAADEDEPSRRAAKRIEQTFATLAADRRDKQQKAFAADQELDRRRKAAQDRLDARIAAEAALKKLMTEAEKKGDKERGPAIKTLLAAPPPKKLEHAASIEKDDPDTARLWRDCALAPDEVKSLQKDEEFFRTADAAERRTRAKQTEAKDPDLAGCLRASADGDEDTQPFAEVHLASGRDRARAPGWFGRIKNWLLGRRKDGADDGPRSLPSDGPGDVDFRSRRASLLEGDLFGEMACLNRRPRSATVTARADGFLLEILGNVLDEIDKDPDYQKERQRVYRRRVLELHLRDLGLFKDLSDSDYAQVVEQIRDKVELVTFASGQVICDEHDRSDAIYLVRDGIVQVMQNVSALLRAEDVKAKSKLADQAKSATGPAAATLKLLPENILKALQGAAAAELARPLQVAAAIGFNEIIKSTKLATLPEMKPILDSDKFKQRGYYLPADRKAWNESQLRRGQRLLLEEIFPDAFAPLPAPSASGDRILTYLSRGEVFGEIGVVEKTPRTATCVAYGQPRIHADQKDLGRVELVKLSQQLVLELIEKYPILKEKIGKVIESRRRHTREVQEQAVRASAVDGASARTAEVARLGLIQGQRLMLIDLERCTRCDECVKACVDSHDDGRTRLFLTGPRFGKYLVPFTCRACLDPVCMIGCPVRSIQRGDNLEIQIKDWCIGCGICARQCPYDSIQIHPLQEGESHAAASAGNELVELRGRAAVCDMCSSLADPDPRCVYACPHEAAVRVNFGRDLAEAMK